MFRLVPLVLLTSALHGAPSTVEIALMESEGLEARYPCPDDPTSFCPGTVKVTISWSKGASLTRGLSVRDASGKTLLETRVAVGPIVYGDQLLFGGMEAIQSLSTSKPEEGPKRYSRCDCGTEASPYLHAVLNGRGLCVSTRDQNDSEDSGKLWLADGTAKEFTTAQGCVVPKGSWSRTGNTVQLQSSGLNARCQALLRRRAPK